MLAPKRATEMSTKTKFETALRKFANTLTEHVSTNDGQWTVKGFVDTFRNIYTISSDTKIVSKILELHLFPKILAFADEYGFAIVLAEHQNYYPDISFVLKRDESVRFAVDFKTTYRITDKPWLCNGFTLGSHGKYFQDRTSTKNIQFPYGSYLGHFCLGIIYAPMGPQSTRLNPIPLRNFIPSPPLSRISSSLSQRSGKLLVIKAVLATRPILVASSALRISFPEMGCSRSWVRSGLMITG